MTTDPLAEIRAGFFVECEELLESFQDGLSDLSSKAPSPDTINTVFRAVHSIKGGAGAFGFSDLVNFSHRLESVLDALRENHVDLNDQLLKLLFQGADLLQDFLRAARDGSALPDGEPCLRQLEALMPDMGDASDLVFQPLALDFSLIDNEPMTVGWHVFFRPYAKLYQSGNEPLFLLRALQDLGATHIGCNQEDVPPLTALDADEAALSWTIELPGNLNETDIREVFEFVDDLCELSVSSAVSENTVTTDFLPTEPITEKFSAPNPEPEPKTAAGEREARPARDEVSTTVRVDLDRVDRLMNLVGELVINQAMLAQSVSEAGMQSNSAVMTGLESFNSLTREIQDSVMLIRAQAVKPLFQRMARIVREVSAATGKNVRMIMSGESTEVDKTVIERLAEPLTHMIRNAIDHGIESPEKRRAAGKTVEGEVNLSARHRAGRLVIELSDDGAGIDRDKVRRVAASRGLITSDLALSDVEIDNLLFLPGFSTASEVSEVSGRGVGMDVVRQGIHLLGGRIVIESDPGLGTKFTISLPLTLAVLDGMVVTVSNETLVVPLSSITETAALAPSDVRTIAGGHQVLHVRGAFLPIFDLGSELGYRPPRSTEDGGIVLLTAQEDGARAALIVDGIVEQRQVVIKGLQRTFGHLPGIAAATILGDGRIALILDPADLVQNAGQSKRTEYFALAG
ncbi:chemotaxis protein CheA [Paenirhodobacter sp.]|jgi:two-component system chemotaxis sensor kinase CheA|uniref:chemotaxis protein CheA n=1 Tax=Paenirhodobacter sp. TaxID=1965326 RepID=UPI003B509149